MGKIFLVGGSAFLLLLFLVCILYYATLYGAFGKLPTQQELSDIRYPVASEIYAADGSLLGEFYLENRKHTPIAQISPFIKNSLIATEDVRFYNHDGVDKKSYLRVLFKNILGGNRSAGGGSTLTQQLIKNIYPRQSHLFLSTPINKIKEAIIASEMEMLYSKDDILSMYLNTVSFGERAFGIATACERFFDTTPSEVKIEEAAVLIGLLKATTRYSPRQNPERSKDRRNTVLAQMEKADFLEKTQLDSLQKLPLGLRYISPSSRQKSVPYFRQVIREELKNWMKSNNKPDGSPYNLFTDGLKIYTTIDPIMQAYAEEAVAEQMKHLFNLYREHLNGEKPWSDNPQIVTDGIKASARYKMLKQKGASPQEIETEFSRIRPMKVFSWNGGEKEVRLSPKDSVMHYLYFMNAGFLVLDPPTGHVKAWVGGIDYNYFKQDYVSTRRQVGSTFKPFVYAAAIENGIGPCKFYESKRMVYPDYDDWSPQNASITEGDEYSLRGGLSKSVNTVSVKVLFDTGIEKITTLAHTMGIKNPIPEVPSIALGTAELNLLEMVGAYTTFANDGKPSAPNPILKIEDVNGKLLLDFEATYFQEQDQAIHPETNALMTSMLQSVIDEGTGKRLRSQYNIYNDIAGKTGTTQNQMDGWFIGYTPRLVCGAWVGAADRRIRFRNIKLGQGANTALPIWARFYQKLLANPSYNAITKTHFPPLTRREERLLDCDLFIIDDSHDGREFVQYNQSVGNQKRKKNKYSKHQKRKKRRKFKSGKNNIGRKQY